jgi:excisionase family DNA binding protein
MTIDDFNICLRDKDKRGLYKIAIRYYDGKIEKYLLTSHRISREEWKTPFGPRIIFIAQIKSHIKEWIERILDKEPAHFSFNQFKIKWEEYPAFKISESEVNARAEQVHLSKASGTVVADVVLYQKEIIQRLERLEQLNSISKSKLLNIKDASSFLGLTESTIYTYVNQKRIPYVKIGKLMFSKDDLSQWINEHSFYPKKVVKKKW